MPHRSLQDHHEITRRIQLANKHVVCLRKTFLGARTTRRSTKKLVFEGPVMATLPYGSETWIISKSSERAIRNFHRRTVRLMCNVTMFTVQKHSITADTLEKKTWSPDSPVLPGRPNSRLRRTCGPHEFIPLAPAITKLLLLNTKTSGRATPHIPAPKKIIRRRKKVPESRRWILLAKSGEAWRDIIQTPTPSLRRWENAPLPGQRVCIGNGYISSTILIRYLPRGIHKQIPGA
jgi:hypothetical protein